MEDIAYKLLKPISEEDQAELLRALRDIKSELEYVNPDYVKVDNSPETIKKKDDALLKDIFDFFGFK